MNKQNNNFLNRIQIERQILKLVNNSLNECRPLSGLTIEAINYWSTNNFLVNENKKLNITMLLKEISKFVKLENDCSKDVFEEIKKPNNLNLNTLIKELENELA